MGPANAPPALTQIAQRYQQTSRGVVAFRMHRTLDVHGAFRSRHEDIVMQGIYQDGATVKVHVNSYTIDGHAAGASDVSSLEESWDHPKPSDVFAAPFDPSRLDTYEYQQSGPSTISFTSNVHDAGHGKGSFTYNGQNDVVSLTYQPNVLPPHASSGRISEIRSEVLPGYWAITQESQQYKGNYGPFPAAGTLQVVFSNFRRFPDLPSALRTLDF